MKVKCSNCFNEVPEGSVFCPYCGKKVLKLKTCRVCGYETSEDFEYCPMCGNKISGQDECPSCGAKLDSQFDFCPVCGKDLCGGKKDKIPKAKRVRNKAQNIKLKKILSNRKTIERVVVAVASLVLFICSFFCVVETDFSNMLDDMYPTIRLEGDIKMQLKAVSLIDFAFFSAGLDSRSANRYIADYDANELNEDIVEIMTDRKNVVVENNIAYLTKTGCNKITALLSSQPYLKLAYAQAVAADRDAASSEMILYKMLGVFCLVFILFSFATFVVATVSIFYKKDIAKTFLLILLSMLIVIVCLFTATTDSNFDWNIGGAYGVIVAFTVLILAYYIAMSVIEKRRIEWQRYTKGLVTVILGIILVCLFTTPVLKVALQYETSVTVNELHETEVYEFQYGYGYGDMFEEYNSSESPVLSEVEKTFNDSAEIYKNNTYLADEYFKESIGLGGILLNTTMRQYYGWLIEMCKIQPFAALISLILSASLFAYGISLLLGNKMAKAYKYVALALILACSIYSIVIPIVMHVCILTTKGISSVISVGGGVIATTVIAIIGIVACGLTNLFKGKITEFGKSKNRYTGSVSDKKTVYAEDNDATDIAALPNEMADVQSDLSDNGSEGSAISSADEIL